MTKNMNDKTAIDAMEKAKKIVRKFPQIEQAVLAPMLTLEIARALLADAEGERERLQTQIDDIADELGCTEKTSHRHSHGRCIFAAIENLRTAGRREGLELHKEAWGALNFILAFYDSDANRYLDTNAWKDAEASGRRVRAKLRELIDAFPAPPKEKP